MQTHPLDEAAARVGRLTWFRLDGPGAEPTPGSVSAGELLDGVDEWLAEIIGWLKSSYGDEVHPVVPATYLIGWYTDALVRTNALLVEAAGIAPTLSPDSLHITLQAGLWPVGARVSDTRFWCRSDHPSASHPDATPDNFQSSLRLRAQQQVEPMIERFHERFQPAVRIGSHQRWGIFDDLSQSAQADAQRAAGSAGEDIVETDEFRQSCCFAFKLDPALLCTRCPRLRPPPEPRLNCGHQW